MSPKHPIALASDHAGLDLKKRVAEWIQQELGYPVNDLGAFSDESVDYPDFGMLVARAVSTGEADFGILICGTGIGMSIIANKFSGVRAALCHNKETASMSRQHNDANILVLGARVLPEETALDLVRTWFNTPFEGGRHQRRIDKIHELEGSC